MRTATLLRTLLFIALTTNSFAVIGHGYAGDRFFPSTLALEDPFVISEAGLVFHRFQYFNDEGESAYTSAASIEVAKTLLSDLQISVEGTYLHNTPPNTGAQNGFDNFEIGLRYLAFSQPEWESLVSLGLAWEIGKTGSHIVEAETESSISPQLLFGQGFGRLVDEVKYLRPFAVTGLFAPEFSTTHFTATDIDWGIALEYSFTYLQTFVEDFNMPWMNHVIPVVEIPLSTCTHECNDHKTTGTINPGIILFNKFAQVGVEAAIPMNKQSGSKVGYFLQFHLYMDDLFPNTWGKPVFGSHSHHHH